MTPANDAEGCLQDGHWAEGLIGYFPTYTLGDVFGAQLFARAGEELGDLEASFARGEFGELVRWLGERIYRAGGPLSLGAADRGGDRRAARPPAAGGGAPRQVLRSLRPLSRSRHPRAHAPFLHSTTQALAATSADRSSVTWIDL